MCLAGKVLAQLHGEVPEDESTCVAALPGVPGYRQRERSGHGPKDWEAVVLYVTTSLDPGDNAFLLHLSK